MATGNLILGLGRRSVGDITMYRRRGKQVTRVRVRKIKNPNSTGQLYQRAIFSTIGKAYKAGQAIFDHSFEGVAVGDASMNKFKKENLAALRAAIAADINGGLTGATGGQGVVVARGSVTSTPWKYVISQGSAIQKLFVVAPLGTDANILVAKMVAATEGQTVAEFVAANNLSAGDIFTVCVFGILSNGQWSTSDAAVFSKHFPTAFGFMRLTVKESALTSTVEMSAAVVPDLFEVESTGEIYGSAKTLASLQTDGIPVDHIVEDCDTGSMGVIRSREDSGIRSNSEMVVPAVMRWGIQSADILDAWDPNANRLGNSRLILEGGNF